MQSGWRVCVCMCVCVSVTLAWVHSTSSRESWIGVKLGI